MKSRPPTTLAVAEQKIAALISPGLEAKALAELESCLDAEVYVRSSRDACGVQYRAVPDRAIRLASAVKVLEFKYGRPGTSLALSHPVGNDPTVPSRIDLASLMAQNPALVHRIIDAHVAATKQAIPAAPDQ